MTETRLKFISRHQPTAGQELVAQKMGYICGLEPVNIFFSEDPVADLEAAEIFPNGFFGMKTELAGVFPLATALALLRAGFILVVFTNMKDARDASKFICSGADIISLNKTNTIRLTPEEIATCDDAAVESRLFFGSRALDGGAQ